MASPSSESVSQVQRSYIAYHNRPGDPGGVEYWSNRLSNGESLEYMINAFLFSSEAPNLYSGVSTTGLISAVYRQAFNRVPDDSGLDYWADRINAGDLSTGEALLAIVEGASGNDLSIITNKLNFSIQLTNSLSSDDAYNSLDLDALSLVMSLIDESEASLQNALNAYGKGNEVTENIQHIINETDFSGLFVSDFYNVTWKLDSNNSTTISWSIVDSGVLQLFGGEEVEVRRAFSNEETFQLERAFAAWSEASGDLIQFERSSAGNDADIALAWTFIDGPGNIGGFWNYAYNNSLGIFDATIRFDFDDPDYFINTALHEIGNILGLGDYAPSADFQSVLEDPFPYVAEVDQLPLTTFDQAALFWLYDFNA
jgi:hypothetical protein